MIILNGKYNKVKIFSNNIEQSARVQVEELLNQDFVANSKIRIMPDVHAGAGCVIGFTANLGDKVVPNLIGVDLGCGVYVLELGKINLDLDKLDTVINSYVPSGFNFHKSAYQEDKNINNLICLHELSKQHIFEKQIGTLGGGNHMIEIDIDNNGNQYLIIHSGSRNLGKQVADYYQNLAIESCKGLGNLSKLKKDLIDSLKNNDKGHLIQSSIRELEKQFEKAHPKYPKDLCFLRGQEMSDYLHDMDICQTYASKNRKAIANIIIEKMFFKTTNQFEYFETIHNYIDFRDNIIRKGAVSAYKGEKLIIPMNMRDGSLLCTGKGNADWNFSAPHGAGRLMSRSEAKRTLNLEEFKDSMSDIHSTSVCEGTLDESPVAYKPMEEIISQIGETVKIDKIIKPAYNFKAH